MVYMMMKCITKWRQRMTTATVSAKGWVVIPKEYRERYGFKPGTRVQFIDYGGVLSIVPAPQDPITEGLGALRRFGGKESWTQTLLSERAAEREQEERKVEHWLRP
jgi:AbrB family looped-hinge helix DNA binding protein